MPTRPDAQRGRSRQCEATPRHAGADGGQSGLGSRADRDDCAGGGGHRNSGRVAPGGGSGGHRRLRRARAAGGEFCRPGRADRADLCVLVSEPLRFAGVAHDQRHGPVQLDSRLQLHLDGRDLDRRSMDVLDRACELRPSFSRSHGRYDRRAHQHRGLFRPRARREPLRGDHLSTQYRRTVPVASDLRGRRLPLSRIDVERACCDCELHSSVRLFRVPCPRQPDVPGERRYLPLLENAG